MKTAPLLLTEFGGAASPTSMPPQTRSSRHHRHHASALVEQHRQRQVLDLFTDAWQRLLVIHANGHTGSK